MEFPGEKQKKSPLKRSVMVTGSIFCSVITAILLLVLLTCSGDTSAAVPGQGGSYGIMDRFDMAIGNAVSDALNGIHSVKKVYFLPDDASPAPRPNWELSGTIDTPKDMADVLEKAEEQFPGESWFFSRNTEILEGSSIRYYLDDSIYSVSWKQPVEGCVYTFAEVKVGHPTQFRRMLSGGEYGSGVLYTPSHMAKSVQAVTASSGDYYAYRDKGVMVYGGNTYMTKGDRMDTCFVDDQGDLILKQAEAPELDSKDTVQAFVEEHHIRFSLCFGPILVENGEVMPQHEYPVGEGFKHYSRAAICQQGKLHYLMVMANMEENYPHPPSIPQFAENLQAMGIQKAYALDGGQTATLIANQEIVNSISYGNERKVSDIIYFATAVPETK